VILADLLSTKLILPTVGYNAVCGVKSTEVNAPLFLWRHTSTSDKYACSNSGHCDTNAVYSVTMHYGDYCHEDASSYVLSHRTEFQDAVLRTKN